MKTKITEVKEIFIKFENIFEFRTRIQEYKEIFIIMRDENA